MLRSSDQVRLGPDQVRPAGRRAPTGSPSPTTPIGVGVGPVAPLVRTHLTPICPNHPDHSENHLVSLDDGLPRLGGIRDSRGDLRALDRQPATTLSHERPVGQNCVTTSALGRAQVKGSQRVDPAWKAGGR